jgi:hypothetical protein
MQTFLPVPDFKECARILDKKRVWKQVIEAKTILDILEREEMRRLANKKKDTHSLITLPPKPLPWQNHPVTRMWRGYEGLLTIYYNTFLRECIDERQIRVKVYSEIILPSTVYPLPSWMYDERVYSSHRSNLLRKDPVYYGKFGWTEDNTERYFWPV